MAKEFASVGVPYPAGKATARGESYYAGIGGNKAHNPPEAVGAALDADRKNTVTAAEGGMFSGPKSGYPATLKDISKTNAAAAGSSEKMLRYSQN